MASNLTELDAEHYKSFGVSAKRLAHRQDYSWVHFSLLPKDTRGWHNATSNTSAPLELFAGLTINPHSGINVLNTTCFDTLVTFFRSSKPVWSTVEGVTHKVSIFAIININ